jgi:acyl-CoA thioesterase I
MFKTLLKSCAVLAFTLFIVSCGSGTATGSDIFVVKKATKPTVVLVFGDSISQGYGTSAYGNVYQQVTPGNTYVELLRQGIQTAKIGELAPVTIINASLGSEFTADAIARLPALLAQYKPTHVLLAHGTNDAWTDLPNSYISNNFGIMVDMVKNSGAKVFLVDVTFSLYGTEFANAYSNMVLSLANATGSTYINLLNGVFGNSKYYLGDGVHLNDSAQPTMMKNVWDQLIPTFD